MRNIYSVRCGGRVAFIVAEDISKALEVAATIFNRDWTICLRPVSREEAEKIRIKTRTTLATYKVTLWHIACCDLVPNNNILLQTVVDGFVGNFDTSPNSPAAVSST